MIIANQALQQFKCKRYRKVNKHDRHTAQQLNRTKWESEWSRKINITHTRAHRCQSHEWVRMHSQRNRNIVNWPKIKNYIDALRKLCSCVQERKNWNKTKGKKERKKKKQNQILAITFIKQFNFPIRTSRCMARHRGLFDMFVTHWCRRICACNFVFIFLLLE